MPKSPARRFTSSITTVNRRDQGAGASRHVDNNALLHSDEGERRNFREGALSTESGFPTMSAVSLK